MSLQYVNLPGYGNYQWKAPVPTAADLPTVNNLTGDARVAQDTSVIYVWSGSNWVANAGTSGVSSLNALTGAVTLAAGTNITLTPSGNTITIAATGSGSGSVTSVSVVSANGLAGTVANATTTPAITLSTSITGVLKGNGTAISAATAGTDYVIPSGSITGTAANITASSNSTLVTLSALMLPVSQVTGTTNSTITTLSSLSLPYSQITGAPAAGITQLTSDGTAGPGSGSQAFTLATVNTNTGSFGSSTAIPSFTVNGKGLITAASTNVVIAPAGTLSGTTLNSTVVTSSLTSVGTITSGTWTGTTIAIANGGTGQTTASAAFNALSPITSTGDLILGNGTNSATRLAIGTNTYVLTSNGTTASWAAPASAPTFADSLVNTSGTVTLVNDSTSPGNSYYYGTNSGGTKGFYVLPVASGTSTPTANTISEWDSNVNMSANSFITGYATTVTAGTTTTLSATSAQNQFFTGTTFQTVKLPVVSTLALGQSFIISNLSNGQVTVQSSGGNTLLTMNTGTLVATVISTSGTSASSWSYTFSSPNVTFPVTVANGGTGQTSNLTQYGVVYGSTTSTMATTSAGTTGYPLLANTSSGPNFGQLNLAGSGITGTLAVGNGGTGNTSNWTQYGAIYASTTGVLSSTAAGTANYPLVANSSAAPTFQQLSLTAGVTGTLPIANGGTGQTTAAAAFSALSPITTTGDIIYSSSGTTNSRLGIGTTNQVLTVSGGVPAWVTPAVSPLSYASGYISLSSSTANWNTTSTSFATPTISTGSSSYTSRQSSGITVTSTGNIPGITFTPASSSSVYMITASFQVQCTSAEQGAVQLYGTTASQVIAQASYQSSSSNPITLSGIFAPSSASAQTVMIQALTGNSGDQFNIGYNTGLSGLPAISWTIVEIV